MPITKDTTHLIAIADNGTNYRIVNLFILPSGEFFDPQLFIAIKHDLFSSLAEKQKEYELFLNKNAKEKEELTLDDFSFIKIEDKLIKDKEHSFSVIRSALQNRLGTEILLDFFDYTNLNNLFLSKGFNIVKDQEDTFFDIISSDDEDLKEKLGDYLELYDKINSYRQLMIAFEKAKKDIFRAQTKEDVLKAEELFLALF